MSECQAYSGASEIRYSAIYCGDVSHRRLEPKRHQFQYRVFMMYLDLDELNAIATMSPFWGCHWASLARFKREDFHGDKSIPLKEAVKNTVEKQLGSRPSGAVRVLANWSYFGYNMNPLATYYCFEDDGKTLHSILAEVSNTPWGEKHAYALHADSMSNAMAVKHEVYFDKVFSVSPFHPLNMHYRWLSNTPNENLYIHIENTLDGKRVFDATLTLKRKPVTSLSLNASIARYPFMTFKVVAAIYWQALRLYLRGIPFLGKDKIVQNGIVQKNSDLD